MDVLFVTEKGWFFGGVEQLVNDLAAGLAGRGHRLRLLSTEPPSGGREALTAPFEERTCLDPAAAPGAWRRHLERLLETAPPAVVFVHRFASIEALSPFQGRVPVVRYVPDHDLYCPRRHKYFPLSLRICQRPMGAACVLHGCLLQREGPVAGLPGVTNLLAKRRELRRHHRLDRLCVGSEWMRRMLLANGFDDGSIAVLPPVPAGLETAATPLGDEPLVLFVGQVIRGKGVDLLLRALTTVSLPFHAMVIGTGRQLTGCTRLARELGLGERVSFLGWTPHDRLRRCYQRARVVAVPSRWPEPFGMVGLEAMWAARPVVGFAVGGIPDWLEDGRTGYAVPEQDWHALGGAIEHLLADRELAATLGANGRRTAAERFRFEQLLDATESLLAQCIGPGTAAAEP